MGAEKKHLVEFVCDACGHVAPRVRFVPRTGCEACGCDRVEARYPNLTREALLATMSKSGVRGLWRFHIALPVEAKARPVKAGEGRVPLDRWVFLERFAERYAGVRCTVFAHRHDCQPATGSMKDLSASLVATALRVRGIKEYVVCSTGNTGAAYASYLSRAGITLHAFLPESAPAMKEAEIGYFGQNVYRVLGDYAAAKRVAEDYAIERGIPFSGGNFDPFRVEAKRTMVFKWLRRLERLPDVYVQAISGGTGPLAVAKASRELIALGLAERGPRLILSQPHLCDPMAQAWRRARAEGFPEGWENEYPIIRNPQSTILTLATGNPTAYPYLARLVRAGDGAFFTFPEELAPQVARVVAFETGAFIGPAAAIGIGGFFAALKQGAIADGELVMIAVTDSIRRDPEFLLDQNRPSVTVREISDCRMEQRAAYVGRMWAPLVDYVTSTRGVIEGTADKT
jgi:threonine synthase